MTEKDLYNFNEELLRARGIPFNYAKEILDDNVHCSASILCMKVKEEKKFKKGK